MGNLIKVLTKDIDNNTAGKFFLDFENAQPTAAEREVWEMVNKVLTEAMVILEELQSYTGAGEEIRQAIQNPSQQGVQDRAWAAVVPLVGKLKRFYQFSQNLECTLRALLTALTSSPSSPTQHLEQEQALARQFAEILHFTLRFDELKMTNPAIQNDFSYYRRTISRMRINNINSEDDFDVNNELANRMSLFYASATPMLKTLSDATTKFVSDNPDVPVENTTDCLSTMACVCKVMLETPVMVGVIILYDYVHPAGAFVKTSNIDNPDVPVENTTDCLSTMACVCKVMLETPVMVGVIILYDYVHPAGAFVKTSNIDMKGCIKVLKEQPPNSVEGLLNALRYTTKHLNDESTSKQIKNLLLN